MWMWMWMLLLHQTSRCKSKGTQACLILLVWFQCLVVFVFVDMFLCTYVCCFGCIILFDWVGSWVVLCFAFALVCQLFVAVFLPVFLDLFLYSFQCLFQSSFLSFFLSSVCSFVCVRVCCVKLLVCRFHCMLGHGCLSMDRIIIYLYTMILVNLTAILNCATWLRMKCNLAALYRSWNEKKCCLAHPSSI